MALATSALILFLLRRIRVRIIYEGSRRGRPEQRRSLLAGGRRDLAVLRVYSRRRETFPLVRAVATFLGEIVELGRREEQRRIEEVRCSREYTGIGCHKARRIKWQTTWQTDLRWSRIYEKRTGSRARQLRHCSWWSGRRRRVAETFVLRQ